MKRLVERFRSKHINHIVAFTPKGGCPLKHLSDEEIAYLIDNWVAFTPKGGCPLKRERKQQQRDARLSARR